jgi:hypothetical protein
MLSIFNPSQSMNILKKINLINHNDDKNTSIITKEFFTTHRLFANTLLNDMVPLIRQYSILLKYKDLETNKPFAKKWDDFSIPIKYYPLLTIKQITVLESMFTSLPFVMFGRRKLPEVHYILESDKQYKKFITLPIELREYLTLLPKSVLEEQLQPHSLISINQKETIEVKRPMIADIIPNQNEFYGSVPKPIIPEKK